MIPFYQSVNGGPPEPITALSPVAWYRYGIGITSAGGLVSAWADQSGNGNDLVQATGTNQPALQADNSILFDGVDNQMEATFTLNQPCTFYLLLKQVTWALSDVIFDGSAAQTQLTQTATTPGLKLVPGASFPQNNSLTLDAYGVVTAIFNGASSLLQINNGSPSTENTTANNPGGFSIGANRTMAAASNIQVKEIILFPVAHDAATRTTVITYLATVGGLNI